MSWEQQYLNLLEDILKFGEDRVDRTGTGTRALFGRTMRIDLSKGFPLVTTKQMPFKSILSELLWFIEGSQDERRLAEILHGTRDTEKTTIWTANAEAPYWKPRAKFLGDLGPIYGAQWRRWKTGRQIDSIAEDGSVTQTEEVIDQLSILIDKLKSNPTDRRHIISAWNPGQISEMALPPCHMTAMFYLSNQRKLSCSMIQRSSDVALGKPFNIASYALLTHMIAQVINADVGDLIINTGDTHLYLDHLNGVKEQLTREPFDPPSIWLNPEIKNIEDFTMADIKVIGYKSHGKLNLKMAV